MPVPSTRCTPTRLAKLCAGPRLWLIEKAYPEGLLRGLLTGRPGARYSVYQAARAQAVATETCSHEYMPCDPSGLKITMTQVDKPAMTATARRDWASGAATASGQEKYHGRAAGTNSTTI